MRIAFFGQPKPLRAIASQAAYTNPLSG